MKTKLNILVILALLLTLMGGTVTPAQAAEGDLDLTFGTDGVAVTDTSGVFQWVFNPNPFTQQSDGKIIVGGISAADYQLKMVARLERYNADGTLDEDFGEAGVISPSLPDNIASYVSNVFIGSQGEIIVMGSFAPENYATQVYLARYDSNGDPVEGFGTEGVLLIELPEQVYSMIPLGSALQGADRILVAGQSEFPNPDDPSSKIQGAFLMRLTLDGEIDISFGENGLVLIPFVYGLGQILLPSDGNILVSGYPVMERPIIFRFNSDGGLDDTFGTDGAGYVMPFYDILSTGPCRELAEGPDGKFYMASMLGDDFFLGRLNADGSPDTDYGEGEDGYITLDFLGGLDFACGLLVQADGQVIVGGGAQEPPDDIPGYAMARFNAEGELDTSFGSEGKVRTPTVTVGLFGIIKLEMTPDGKLLVGGVGSDMVVTATTVLARYDLVETGDSSAPTITPDIQGTLGANDWYTSDVTLSWTVADAESDFTSTGCDPVTINADQQDTAYTCEATSAGGTNSVTVHIKRDATGPVLAPSVTPNPVLLNGSATASPNASDATSDVASASCDPVVTSSVGAHSVTCTATDNAGNTATATAAYTVNYNFIGFSQPIDNNGVLNIAKAGQTIPLKFMITDANGNPVTNLTSVSVTAVSLACSIGTTTDLIEEYATGTTGLQNLGNGYYQWNWKTPTTYVNSCKTLNLNLGEGLVHTALFQFKK